MGAQPNRAAAIFDAAVELATAAERAAYLDAACGEDAQLRAEVEGLLAHDNAACVKGPIDGSLTPGMALKPGPLAVKPTCVASGCAELIIPRVPTAGPVAAERSFGLSGSAAAASIPNKEVANRKLHTSPRPRRKR
jgi:hypothetical protein